MMKTTEERFLELYWKYEQLILDVAVKRCGDYHYAQDICQETFTKMLRQLDLSKRDEEIKSWLIVVADNAARDYIKKGGKHRRSTELSLDSGEADRVFVSAGMYFDEIMRREFRSTILDRLKKVNPDQYELVVLVCCLQLSLFDAAKRLNLTYSQAAARLSRARTWLKLNYGQEYLELKLYTE